MRRSPRVVFTLPTAVWLSLWMYYDKTGGAACSICAAVLHELGHLSALWLLRDTPHSFRVGLFGAAIERNNAANLTYGQEMLSAAAGPAVNLLLAGILACLLPVSRRLLPAVQVNLSLALFNLLPLRVLDGGQILYAALCRRRLPEEARKIQKTIAAGVSVPLTAIGILLWKRGVGSYSLLLSSLFAVVSVVLP